MFIIIPFIERFDGPARLLCLYYDYTAPVLAMLLYATPAYNDGRRPLQWLLTRWLLIHILLIFYLQISRYTLLFKPFFVFDNSRPRRVLQQYHINGS